MAKKTKLEADDWDFDGELDMPDFNFDTPQIKDDRNPATKIAVAAADGFKESALSSDNIRHMVKGALPRGYGEALDLADHSATTLKSIYNTTAKELKPVVNEIKKTSQKLVPVADRVLPKGLAERFRKFTTIDDSKARYQQSLEDAQESSLQAELGQVFQAQAEDNQQHRAESDARERIRDGIEFKRHKESSDVLSQISQGIQELSLYQKNVGINFQRKSLELQFRHYFVARDSLEEMKRQNAVTTTNLEAITKNTGLPEYVKLKNTERIGEMMRNKFIGSVGDGITHVRRNFVKKLGEKLAASAKDKARQTADSVRMGLGAFDSLAELQEMQAQMGQAQSGGEIAGGLVGGMAAGAATSHATKWLHKKAHEHAGIVKKGNWLTDQVGQLPQRALKWANGWDGIGKSNIGAGTGWLDFIKGAIRDSLPQQDTSMDGDKLEDIRNPDVFNRRTNRSITDIIPGYLARIYRELRIMRTGDAATELVEYDFTSNKFLESSKLTKNILNSLVSDSDKYSAKSQTEELVNSLDKDATLTPAQRKTLGRLLLKNNMKHGVGDHKLYSEANADEYRGVSGEDAEAFAQVFKTFFDKDETGQKQATFGREFGRLGERLSDKRAMMQDFVNSNQRDHLIKLGLLDKNNNMDMEKFFEYLLEGDSVLPAPVRQARPSQSLSDVARSTDYRQRLTQGQVQDGAFGPVDGLPMSARNRAALSGGFSGYAEASNPQNWNIYGNGQHYDQRMQSNRWDLSGRGMGGMVQNRTGIDRAYSDRQRLNGFAPLSMAPMSQFGYAGVVGGVNGAQQMPTPTRRDLVQPQADANPHNVPSPEVDPTEDDDRRLDNRMIRAINQVNDTLQEEQETRREEREHPTYQGPSHVNFDTKDIVDAIRDAKKPAEDLNTIVARIEQKLNEGITINGVVNGQTGGSGGDKWYNKGIGDAIGDAFTGAKNGLGWVRGQVKKGNQRLLGGAKWGWDKAAKAGQWAWGKANELNDIYIKGELMPRLTKAKLLAGEYYIKGKEGAITTFEGIKEDIFDKDGNLVISAQDLADAVQNSSAGAAAMRGLKWIKNGIKKQWERGTKFIPRAYKWAFDMAKKGQDLVMGHVLDRPQDVYVTGIPEPRLTAITMRGGGYRDRASGKPVTRVSQIKGPVINDQNEVVLSDEDIAKGLVDKNGKPIVTGYLGLVTKAMRAGKWAFDKVSKGLKTAKDWTMDKLRGVRDGLKTGEWGIKADLSLGLSSKHQVTLLHQIRDMLNDRLPGEKTTFQEIDFGDGISSRIGKAAKALKDRLKEKAPNWLEKYRAKKEEAKAKAKEKKEQLQKRWDEEGGAKGLWQRGLDGARSAKASAKDKLREHWDKMTESTEERKERFAKLREKKDALMERLAEKKEKAKEKADALKEKGQSKLDLMKQKWEELQQKRREKREAAEKEKAEKSEKGEIDLGDWDGDDDRHGRKRKGRRGRAAKPKGKLGRLASRLGKGRLGGVLRGGGRILGGAGRAAMGVGRLGLGLLAGDVAGMGAGLLGAASGAGGMIAGAAGAVGSAAAGLGGLAMTGLGMAGTALGAVGAVLTSPVVLGAAAIAGLAYGGYKLYQYMNRQKLTTFNKVRYAQYGFLPNDEDHFGRIIKLEDMLKDAVQMSGQQAGLDEKKVDFKEMAETFDIDNTNKEQMQNFANWFVARFKPVFLTNVAAVRTVGADKWLDDIEDMKPEEKRKYLNVAKFPGGPYNVFTSPFTDQSQLAAGPQEVASAIAVAEAELQKTEKDGKGKTDGAKAGAAGVAGAAAALENKAPSDNTPERLNLSERPDETVGSSKLDSIGAAMAGGVSVKGPDAMADFLGDGRLDAMTAIRYKAYGLKDLTADKVKALAQTEAEVYKSIKISNGVEFKGLPEVLVANLGAAYGIAGVVNNAAYDWINWFNNRFLPVYLAYLTAITTVTKAKDLKTAQNLLRPMQAVDVATMTYTAKTPDGVSVWRISTSPWAGYELNNDVTTVDGNMQGLKDKAKSSKVSEETAKPDTGMQGDGASAAALAAAASAKTPTRPQDQPGFFSKLWSGSDGKGGIAGAATSAWEGTKSAASNMWDGAKSALGIGGGREMGDMGNGSGGLIDQIPKPTGSGKWEHLKGTIGAAAKMVGVDEKLMASMAAIESGFQWAVKAGSSSATGLYQFIKSTWDSMVKQYGPKYGIGPDTPATDPRANALMGAEYLKYNANALKGVVKDRKLTDTDLYIAHFLGTGGAKKFLSANPNEIAANLFPDAARANPTIFYKDGRPATVSEVYALMNSKLRTRGKQFGIDDGSEQIQAMTKPSGEQVKAGAPSPADLAKQTGTKPNATSDGIENPSQNLLAKPVLPVSDQSVGPKSTPTVPVAASPATSAGSDPMNALSQRSRDVAVQQQMQRDAAADLLVKTNEVLGQQLEAQRGILKATQDLLQVVKDDIATRGAQPKGALKEPMQPAQAAPVKAARPMTEPPVSMRKSTNYQ